VFIIMTFGFKPTKSDRSMIDGSISSLSILRFILSISTMWGIVCGPQTSHSLPPDEEQECDTSTSSAQHGILDYCCSSQSIHFSSFSH